MFTGKKFSYGHLSHLCFENFFPLFHVYRTELIDILKVPEFKGISQIKHDYIKIIKHGWTE